MKCLETETLVQYAYRLIDDEAASQVRLHLHECPQCRKIVEQHARLGAVMDEWKVAEPTPAFDSRVRLAIEAHRAQPRSWGIWGMQWARGLALAALGVMIIAGVAWLSRSHQRSSSTSMEAMRQAQWVPVPKAPEKTPKVPGRGTSAPASVRAPQAAPQVNSGSVLLNDDKDAPTLEDYDLATNFDILSEIPKGSPRVAN